MWITIYEWIIISTVVLAVFSLVVVKVGSIKKAYNADYLEIYKKYWKKKNTFLVSSMIWTTVYFWLFLVAMLSTIFVIHINAYNPTEGDRIFLYSVLSFFLIVAELVLQPRKIANGYRKAYTIMDAGLNKYGKSNKETGIVKCLDKAEKIIRSVHKL